MSGSKDLRGFWNQKNDPVHVKQLKRAEKHRQKRARRKLRKQSKLEKVNAKVGVKPIGAPHADYRRDDRFYRSEAWRRLRYVALKNCQGRCQCCGASAADGVVMHVDHIKPRYEAPWLSLEISNLQVLCEDCNIGKGAWDSTDWRNHMRAIVGE